MPKPNPLFLSFVILGLVVMQGHCGVRLVQSGSSSQYDFFINSVKVGSEKLSISSKGVFVSKTVLTLGANEIKEKVSGNLKHGKITSYESIANEMGRILDLKWDGKTVYVLKPASPSVPFNGKVPIWYGNEAPALSFGFQAYALDVNQAKTVKTFLFDAGPAVDGKLTYLGKQTYREDGKIQSAEHFIITLGLTKINVYCDNLGHFLAENVPSQGLKVLKDGITGIFSKSNSKGSGLNNQKILSNQPCLMRDGVKLSTDVVLPSKVGKYPAILVRTPYGKELALGGANEFVKHGYAYVVQDVRGTGASGGKWDPFMNEEKDGYDTIEWVSKQPWCNGKVGMIGASYSGYTQWAAAVMEPPALKCMIPEVSPPDAMTNIPYEFGTFQLFDNLWYQAVVAKGGLNLSQMNGLKHPRQLLDLPLSSLPGKVIGMKGESYQEWLKRTGYDDFKGFDYEKDILNVKIPVLNISGWWDGDGIGTDLNWMTMEKAGRKNMWLIEGPWTHEFNTTTQLAGDIYGKSAILNLTSLEFQWFDHWLKEDSNGFSKVPKVKYFVMTQDQWHSTSTFPDPKSHKAKLYLSAKSTLTTSEGQGTSKYIYDPSKVKIPDAFLNKSPKKVASLDIHFGGKNDHATFVSQPCKSSKIITGPFDVKLSVKVNVKSTDLYAFVYIIDTKGPRIPFSMEGKLNLSYIDGLDKPLSLIPNHIYTAHIMPWIGAREILKGERLGLTIRSEDFPMTARNLNTGQPIVSAVRMVPATITILHDRANPSWLTYYELPIQSAKLVTKPLIHHQGR